jgi:nucleotide-binding universal stress UspA family protein
MARIILHPTDFSPASRPAFRKALELARKGGRQLLIAHVITPPMLMVGDGYVSPQVYDEMERTARVAAQKRLDRLAAAARARGVRTSTAVLEGVYHDQITRLARARRAEMIVIGTHGRTGLKRLMLGSVAARVLGTAPCPVLAVRAGR